MKILLISVLSSGSFTASAQVNNANTEIQYHSRTYEVINSSNTDVTEYHKAMESANFDSYRFLNSRRQLTFESGVVIELFSVREVQDLGIAIDESKATSDELPQGYIPPTYKIKEGKIIAMHTLNPRKK